LTLARLSRSSFAFLWAPRLSLPDSLIFPPMLIVCETNGAAWLIQFENLRFRPRSQDTNRALHPAVSWTCKGKCPGRALSADSTLRAARVANALLKSNSHRGISSRRPPERSNEIRGHGAAGICSNRRRLGITERSSRSRADCQQVATGFAGAADLNRPREAQIQRSTVRPVD
jgi:hypothetical protein